MSKMKFLINLKKYHIFVSLHGILVSAVQKVLDFLIYRSGMLNQMKSSVLKVWRISK